MTEPLFQKVKNSGDLEDPQETKDVEHTPHSPNPMTSFKSHSGRFLDVFALFLDLFLRLFDTASDLAVAVAYWMDGDKVWFLISALILGISMIHMGHLAIRQESKWLLPQERWWVSPKEFWAGLVSVSNCGKLGPLPQHQTVPVQWWKKIFWPARWRHARWTDSNQTLILKLKIGWQGLLGMLSIRPIFIVWHVLQDSNWDPKKYTKSFQHLRALEEERFSEGLFETMAQLFLQTYVFFVKMENGGAESISVVSIVSVVISFVCMAKTLLEKYPSRSKALSWLNMTTLYLFVFFGVVSRCAAVIGTSLLFPGGFIVVFAAEIVLTLFIQLAVVDWHYVKCRHFTSLVRPMPSQDYQGPENASNQTLETAALQHLKSALASSFYSAFVFCPLTISEQIGSVDLSIETLSLTCVMWVHSVIASCLVSGKPTPNSQSLGWILWASIGLQILFLFYHHQALHKIKRISVDFFNLIKQAQRTKDVLLFETTIPGEVDVNFVHEDQNVLMALCHLDTSLSKRSNHNSSPSTQITHSLCLQALERGADALFENKLGQTSFSFACPELQHTFMECLLSQHCGVSYDRGNLKIAKAKGWDHIETFIKKGLHASSLDHPELSNPYRFQLLFIATQIQNYSQVAIHCLISCLQGNQSVTVVDFSNFSWASSWCSSLGSAIKASRHIPKLFLGGSDFSHVGDDHLNKLFVDISQNQSLTTLDLHSCNLTNNHLAILLSSFASNKIIERLDFSSNNASDSAEENMNLVSIVSKFFTTNQTLQILDLSGNVRILDPKTATVFQGLAGNRVDLSDTPALKIQVEQKTAEAIVSRAQDSNDIPVQIVKHAELDYVLEFVAKAGFLNFKDKNGVTALEQALLQSNATAVVALIKHGADCRVFQSPDQASRLVSLLFENFSEFEPLVPEVLDIMNSHKMIDARDKLGRTVLFLAVEKGKDVLVKQICSFGANYKLLDERGFSALSLACSRNFPLCAGALSAMYTPQEALTDAWNNPNRNAQAVFALIQHGAQVQEHMIQECVETTKDRQWESRALWFGGKDKQLESKATNWSYLSGTPIKAFSTYLSSISGPPQPDNDFPIFATSDTSQILVLNKTTSNFFTPFQLCGLSGFDPLAIALSSTGEIFVTGSQSGEVHVFGMGGGNFIRSFGLAAGKKADFYGLAIDHSKHQVHVCDYSGHCIHVFTEEGGFIFSYGSSEQLTSPSYVAVDGERGLVAVSDSKDQISIFTTSGKFVRLVGQTELSRNFGGQPYIAADLHSGHLFVSNNGNVHVVTWDGKWVSGFGKDLPLKGPQGLVDTRVIAVGSQQELFVVCKIETGNEFEWCTLQF